MQELSGCLFSKPDIVIPVKGGETRSLNISLLYDSSLKKINLQKDFKTLEEQNLCLVNNQKSLMTKQWTVKDSIRLLDQYEAFGNQWKLISTFFSNTGDNFIKNKFYSILRRFLRNLAKRFVLDKISYNVNSVKPKVLNKFFDFSFEVTDDDNKPSLLNIKNVIRNFLSFPNSIEQWIPFNDGEKIGREIIDKIFAVNKQYRTKDKKIRKKKADVVLSVSPKEKECNRPQTRILKKVIILKKFVYNILEKEKTDCGFEEVVFKTKELFKNFQQVEHMLVALKKPDLSFEKSIKSLLRFFQKIIMNNIEEHNKETFENKTNNKKKKVLLILKKIDLKFLISSFEKTQLKTQNKLLIKNRKNTSIKVSTDSKNKITSIVHSPQISENPLSLLSCYQFNQAYGHSYKKKSFIVETN